MNAFCTLKSDELNRRVEHIEGNVALELKSSKEGKEVDWEKIEEETSRITAEVAELSKFIRLNYSAFLKVFLLMNFLTF